MQYDNPLNIGDFDVATLPNLEISKHGGLSSDPLKSYLVDLHLWLPPHYH